MIKINLAQNLASPSGGIEAVEEASDAGLASFQRQGFIKLLIIFLFPIGLYVYEMQLIPEKKKQVSAKERVLATLVTKNQKAKGAVDEIKKFKEDQSKLQKQIDSIEGLRKDRLKEVKILDTLQRDLPDKAWLTKIEFQNDQMLVSGFAISDSELSALMENLSKSIFIREVNLVRASEERTDQGIIKKFEISCVVERPALAGEDK